MLHNKTCSSVCCKNKTCVGAGIFYGLSLIFIRFYGSTDHFYIVGFAILGKRPVFDDFLYGAKEGMQTVVQVLPSLVGLMTAVGVLRASGFLEFLTHILEVPATSIGLPGPIIPIAFIRLVSNSAAVGLVLDLFKNYGPDSQVGLMASILMGSTETVLYCMSVYFGSAGISRTRYTLAGGLLAAFVSLAASVILANQLAL